MKYLVSAVLVSLLSIKSQATTGVDLSTLASTSSYQCMHNAAYSFAIPRAWMSYGAFDPNANANVANARAGGLPYVDVYMFPCRGKDAAS